MLLNLLSFLSYRLFHIANILQVLQGISLAEKWIFLRKLETNFLQNFEYFLYDDVDKIEVASN